MTDTTTTPIPTPAMGDRLRRLWASGDYARVAREVIPSLGERVVRAAGVGPDDRVLDVAAGAGNAAIPAAATGAQVTATDITPELLEHGRVDATARGLTLTWTPADAHDLPYDDASFDVVLSCVGVMFAPFHRRAADELLRVTRPGGRIALLSWTPEGFLGRMLATMRPYAPPPPEGASPPPLWGSEDHVRDLIGAGVRDLRAVREELVVDRFVTGADFRDYFRAHYGPTIAVYAALADAPDRVAELDAALADLAEEALDRAGRMRWEYLLVSATRT